MRKIERIVVHCTDSSPYAPVQNIKNEFKLKGWKNPGYHFLVDITGCVFQLLSTDEIANGVKGYNQTAIHVCYIGGYYNNRRYDTRTPAQRDALNTLIDKLLRQHPEAQLMGHRDLSPDANGNGSIEESEWVKLCPVYDVKTDYKQWTQTKSSTSCSS